MRKLLSCHCKIKTACYNCAKLCIETVNKEVSDKLEFSVLVGTTTTKALKQAIEMWLYALYPTLAVL